MATIIVSSDGNKGGFQYGGCFVMTQEALLYRFMAHFVAKVTDFSYTRSLSLSLY
jgi:hypothetical protein